MAAALPARGSTRTCARLRPRKVRPADTGACRKRVPERAFVGVFVMSREKAILLGTPLLAAAILAFATMSYGQSEGDTIDPSAYRITFDENFDTLDVSHWGPGTRWIAPTP